MKRLFLPLTILVTSCSASLPVSSYWSEESVIENIPFTGSQQLPELDEMRSRANGRDLNSARQKAIRSGVCHFRTEEALFSFKNGKDCWDLDPTRPNVIILGDSHAADLYVALSSAYTNINFIQYTGPGMGLIRDRDESHEKDAVVFSIEALKRAGNPASNLGAIVIHDHERMVSDQSVKRALDMIGSEIPIYFFMPRSEMNPPPRSVFLWEFDGKPRDAQAFLENRTELKETQWSVAEYPYELPENARFIDTNSFICPENRCLFFTPDGYPIFTDRAHWSAQGSEFIGLLLKERFPNFFDIK